MLYFRIGTLHGSGEPSRSSLLSISSILQVKLIMIDTLYSKQLQLFIQSKIFLKYVSVAEYTQSDEGGTDEASGCDDMQSSSAKWSHPSVEDNVIGSIQLGMIFETCDRSVFLCVYVQLTTVNVFGIS